MTDHDDLVSDLAEKLLDARLDAAYWRGRAEALDNRPVSPSAKATAPGANLGELFGRLKSIAAKQRAGDIVDHPAIGGAEVEK